MKKYIVRFENGDEPFWIAPWGDPGRTIVEDNALRFDTKRAANMAMRKTIKDWPDRKLKGRGSIVTK